MNKFDEVRAAVAEAKDQLRAADSVAFNMADLLIGRLHHVDSHRVLAALKQELRGYNIQTAKWKDQP